MPEHGSALDAWDYDLPADRVASRPAEPRSASRLMVVPPSGPPTDHVFSELPSLLRPGDLLVANDTRVMAARLKAWRATGGAIELLCLDPGPGPVRALVRPLRRLRDGEALQVEGGAIATVLDRDDEGVVRLAFDHDPVEVMERWGAPPLPPYLGRDAEPTDKARYQTVYAGPLGAAAAPTAGLHLDAPVLEALRDHGIGWATVTLHVGLGTFRPLRDEDLARGALHAEPFVVPDATVEAIARVRRDGGRVVAVGTTSLRALEAATPAGERIPRVGRGTTDLFIRPGYAFRCVDGLITNFHLPRSSLLLLVAARIGRERLFEAYGAAIQRGYRFYSYGDAMLLV